MAALKILSLGSVTSDKVYSPKKGTSNFNFVRDGLTVGFGATQAARDSVTGISYEFEYDKKFIAFTYTLATNTNASATGRFVWQGDFAYKGDKIISANVASIGLLITSNDPAANSPTRTAGAIYKPDNGFVKDPFKSLQQLISNSTSLGDYQSDGIPGVSAGDIAPFLSYGGGKFFNSGWEANPFKPNLI
jgi:hypothetical protein